MPQTTKYVGQGSAGFTNHQAILRDVWVVIQGSVDMEGLLAYISQILWMHGMKGLTRLGCNNTWMPSIQATDLPRCGSRFGGSTKPPSHQHGSVGCDTRYQWSWIGGNTFHIFCGCIGKVSQAWDVIHTRGYPPSKQ